MHKQLYLFFVTTFNDPVTHTCTTHCPNSNCRQPHTHPGARAPPPEPLAMTAVTAVNSTTVRPRAKTTAAAAAKDTAATKTVTTQMTIVTGQCSTRSYMMVTINY